MRRGAIAGAAVVTALGAAGVAAPGEAAAEPEARRAWHVDGVAGIVVPVAPVAFTDASGFGGRLGARAYGGGDVRDGVAFEGQVDAALFARESGVGEQLTTRIRVLGGARLAWPVAPRRSVLVRALAGLEVAGFDRTGTTTLGERHRPGLAAELGIESRSELEWGGVVSLTGGVGLAAQVLGDRGGGAARYLGVELLFGAALGW